MLDVMRKYGKTVAMSATSFVGDSRLFLFTYLLRFLRVVLLLSIWRIVLAGKGPTGGLTMAQVLTYTLIAEVFAELLACRTWLESAFWDGSIATRFLRPIGVFGQFAAEMFGPISFSLCAFSLPLLLAAPFVGVCPLPANVGAGLLFGLSLTLAVAVALALDYLFAGCAVALQMHPYILNSMRAAITTVLSGAFLPFALMPWGLGKVFSWLPFAAQASAPLQIYVGTGDAPRLLAMQALWALLLWPLAGQLWRRNRERMVSYGG